MATLWSIEDSPHGGGIWFTRQRLSRTFVLCPPGVRIYMRGDGGRPRISTTGWREAIWSGAGELSSFDASIDVQLPDVVIGRSTRQVIDQLPPEYHARVWELMVQQLKMAQEFGRPLSGKGLPDDRALASAQAVALIVSELTEAYPTRRHDVESLCVNRLENFDGVPDHVEDLLAAGAKTSQRQSRFARHLLWFADRAIRAVGEHPRQPIGWLERQRDGYLRATQVPQAPTIQHGIIREATSIEALYSAIDHPPVAKLYPGLGGAKPILLKYLSAA